MVAWVGVGAVVVVVLVTAGLWTSLQVAEEQQEAVTKALKGTQRITHFMCLFYVTLRCDSYVH